MFCTGQRDCECAVCHNLTILEADEFEDWSNSDDIYHDFRQIEHSGSLTLSEEIDNIVADQIS